MLYSGTGCDASVICYKEIKTPQIPKSGLLEWCKTGLSVKRRFFTNETFLSTLSLFPLFPMYQFPSVWIYKSLIHRKEGKTEGVDKKGGKSQIRQSAIGNTE
jgi:hypothetical protein